MYTMANVEKATKLGTAMYAKTGNNIDIYVVNGKEKRTRQVYFIFDDIKDETEFKAEIQAKFDAFKVTAEAEGKEFDERFPAALGYEVKNGKTQFKFWTYSEYAATKDKPATPKTLPVFVVGKGPLADDKSIGNGSKIQVAYEMSPYWTSKKGFGVSLNVTQILVHELIEFGNRAANDLSVFGVDVSGSGGVFDGAIKSDVPEEIIPF